LPLKETAVNYQGCLVNLSTTDTSEFDRLQGFFLSLLISDNSRTANAQEWLRLSSSINEHSMYLIGTRRENSSGEWLRTKKIGKFLSEINQSTFRSEEQEEKLLRP
jgi:hypothetical protein